MNSDNLSRHEFPKKESAPSTSSATPPSGIAKPIAKEAAPKATSNAGRASSSMANSAQNISSVSAPSKTQAVTPVSSSAPASTPSNNWISEIAHEAERFESSVHSFVRSRPIAATLTAVGIGFVGSMILKALNSSSDSESNSGSASTALHKTERLA